MYENVMQSFRWTDAECKSAVPLNIFCANDTYMYFLVQMICEFSTYDMPIGAIEVLC